MIMHQARRLSWSWISAWCVPNMIQWSGCVLLSLGRRSWRCHAQDVDVPGCDGRLSIGRNGSWLFHTLDNWQQRVCISFVNCLHVCYGRLLARRPRLYFALWQKRLSSIWTMIPGPPRLIGVLSSLVVHISLMYWYTCMVVFSEMHVVSTAFFTIVSWHHKYRKYSHLCKGTLDFEKDHVLMDRVACLLLHFPLMHCQP